MLKISMFFLTAQRAFLLCAKKRLVFLGTILMSLEFLEPFSISWNRVNFLRTLSLTLLYHSNHSTLPYLVLFQHFPCTLLYPTTLPYIFFSLLHSHSLLPLLSYMILSFLSSILSFLSSLILSFLF